jgi:hypothetical protein
MRRFLYFALIVFALVGAVAEIARGRRPILLSPAV